MHDLREFVHPKCKIIRYYSYYHLHPRFLSVQKNGFLLDRDNHPVRRRFLPRFRAIIPEVVDPFAARECMFLRLFQNTTGD